MARALLGDGLAMTTHDSHLPERPLLPALLLGGATFALAAFFAISALLT